MSTDTVNNDGTTEQSLEDFAAELFGGSDAAPDNAKSEEATEEDAEVNGESEEDTLDTQTDDDNVVSEDDDTLAQDEDDEAEEGDEESSSKPKKKNRFQERIDELTAARREAERKADEKIAAMQRELEEIRQKFEGSKDKPTEKEPESGSELRAPQKDDVDANGKPKYPLGEYDPKFMRDTVEHMFAEREAQAKQQEKLTAEQRAQQEARAALQTQWNTKLDDARERYPDFQTKGEQMLTVFEGIDEQYGDYLTTTLMEMENGPDVFYYLASNVEEAQAIVAQGAKKATMALAKLDAQLGSTDKPRQPTRRVSAAKTPPPQNKGSAVAKPRVAPDTDDLGAFEKELFRKK